MKEYKIGNIMLICDDYKNHIDYIKRNGYINTVLTDPPYGCSNNNDYTRFTGGLAKNNTFKPTIGDNEPFDPTPFLNYENVILWGANYFANKLPIGTWLVWNKKRDNQLGKFLSDAELAWMKGGHGTYIFHHVWHGFDRASERGKTIHPNQKPVALMDWCLNKIKNLDTVFDPFAGSGPIALSCLKRNVMYLGFEICEEYFDKAVERIQKELPVLK